MSVSRGRRGSAVQFARTYLIALAALVAVGAGILVWKAFALPGSDLGRPRPQGAVLQPYELDYRLAAGQPTSIEIGTTGDECAALSMSDYLAAACALALNVDPLFIAQEAQGQLNNQDTPAFEAIIWRAVLAGDPDVCDQGGLLGERLQECRTAAMEGHREVTRDGVTVVIS